MTTCEECLYCVVLFVILLAQALQMVGDATEQACLDVGGALRGQQDKLVDQRRQLVDVYPLEKTSDPKRGGELRPCTK
jgi:hypothetical protein